MIITHPEHRHPEHRHPEQIFHGPSWRYRLAARHAASDDAGLGAGMDRLTRQAADYLRLCHGDELGPATAARKYPSIAAAFTLLDAPTIRERFQLSILGDLPKTEIASRLKVDKNVLSTAESLFFDLAGMRGATSWITCHVFLPETRAGNLELVARMKIAFFGGPAGARAVLAAHDHLPLAEAQRLTDQEILLHAKLQAALAFELTPASSLAFLKLFTAYDLAREKLELQREEFRYACELARGNQDTATASDRPDKQDATAFPKGPDVNAPAGAYPPNCSPEPDQVVTKERRVA